jgi:hypothetical protein
VAVCAGEVELCPWSAGGRKQIAVNDQAHDPFDVDMHADQLTVSLQTVRHERVAQVRRLIPLQTAEWNNSIILGAY